MVKARYNSKMCAPLSCYPSFEVWLAFGAEGAFSSEGEMPAAASSLSDVLRLATTDADAAATKGIAGDLARAEQAIAAEDAVSEVLRVRHLAGLPYTWLAEDSVLLSCNPQRSLGAMHGRAQIARHASLPAGPAAAEPHIYAVAEAAVRKVLGRRQ